MQVKKHPGLEECIIALISKDTHGRERKYNQIKITTTKQLKVAFHQMQHQIFLNKTSSGVQSKPSTKA